MIGYDEQTQTFYLKNSSVSYVMQVVRGKYLAHVYWGARMRGTNPGRLLTRKRRCSFSPSTDPDDLSLSLDTLPQEFPSFGTSDFRVPAYEIESDNGSTVSELVYESHRIYEGKPRLQGLPATYIEQESEAESIDIIMTDRQCGLKVILTYTIYREYPVVTRSARFVNKHSRSLRLQRALSMSMDMPHDDYDLLHLSGTWIRERHIERRPVRVGATLVESRRGASSHSHNPFIALLAKDAGEHSGEVYGYSLVYSGNFLAQAEVDPYRTTRIVMGINPFNFGWLLEPGDSFQTPEVVLVFSDSGLGGMSRTYHHLYRKRLARGRYRDQTRPVLINNWEATYFDFDDARIEAIAMQAKELGVELFVLDDGWFGKRDNDRSSLGDWVVDQSKLSNGLPDLVQRVNRLGLSFGLWFEPEMVSPDSDLYREHPDWCIYVPDRRRTLARHQLVLDYSRQDVRDYIVRTISKILSDCPIAYVKWDMNRNMTETGSASLPLDRQRETSHRYMLGLYEVLERLTASFPNVLFESCSGGGGRFDPGMLYYMPQTWTSDNTDAVERLKIQYGTSLVYPIISIGSHVSAVPNHQVHRITSMHMRAHVAMSGNFGYELDLSRLSDEELKIAKRQVTLYRKIRSLVQFGDFYRLLSPFEHNMTSWMFVSNDRTEAVVFCFQVLSEPNPPLRRIRLRGLDADIDYRLIAEHPEEQGEERDVVYGGDELMHYGLNIPVTKGDFLSWMYRLKAMGVSER